MMNIELSKEMKQHLRDSALMNEYIMMRERARLREIGKILDLEITSQSYTSGTIGIKKS